MSASSNISEVCRYFNPFENNGCSRGNKCHYLHLTESDAKIIVSKYQGNQKPHNMTSQNNLSGSISKTERLYIECNIYCLGRSPEYRFCTHTKNIKQKIIIEADFSIDLGTIETSDFGTKQNYLDTKCRVIRDKINSLIGDLELHRGPYHKIRKSLNSKYRQYCGFLDSDDDPKCEIVDSNQQAYYAKATECVLDGNKYIVTISACPEKDIEGFIRSEIKQIVLPVKSECL